VYQGLAGLLMVSHDEESALRPAERRGRVGVHILEHEDAGMMRNFKVV
jgi:hypothetical protein